MAGMEDVFLPAIYFRLDMNPESSVLLFSVAPFEG